MKTSEIREGAGAAPCATWLPSSTHKGRGKTQTPGDLPVGRAHPPQPEQLCGSGKRGVRVPREGCSARAGGCSPSPAWSSSSLCGTETS